MKSFPLYVSWLITIFGYANCEIVTYNSTEFVVHSILDGLLSKNSSISHLLENSFDCLTQLVLFSNGVKNRDRWAMMMLDAASKPQSGLLYGNIFHIGNFDECLGINEQILGNNVKGRYCTAAVDIQQRRNDTEKLKEMNVQAKLAVGLCVPNKCSAQDLNIVTNSILKDQGINLGFIEPLCYDVDIKTEIPLRTVLALIFFGGYGLLLIVATLTDMYDLRGNNRLVKCFSMYTNAQKILSVRATENSLDCLNGLRVVSMMLVLLGHRYIFSSGLPAVNMLEEIEGRDYLYNYLFVGLGFAVDTFFVIGGLLVVYLYIKMSEKGYNLSFGMFYLHRLLRLLPNVLVVVLFYATMLQFLEPKMFRMVDEIYGKNCRKYWWTTILFIQNYWNPNDMCAVQTWYLAIDMQMYLLAPLMFMGLKKSAKWTMIVTGTLTVISIIMAFVVTCWYSLKATFLNQGKDEYSLLYTPTHIRAATWLLGALTGYFIGTYKEKKLPITRVTAYALWILSFGSLLLVLFIQKIYYNVDYDVVESALFNALARPLWGIAICTMIILCVYGHGGIINSFLSYPAFNIMIRINYSVYLIHMMVVLTIVTNITTPMYFSNFNMIHGAMGDYCIVTVIGFFWTLAFESPMVALEKIIFAKGMKGENN